MLYLFYGTDSDKIRAKVSEVVGKLALKRPDASIVSFDLESWDEGRFEEMIGAQTLFAGKSVVVARGLFGFGPSSQFILNHTKDIAMSENIFFFEEGDLKKEILSKIEKKAEKVQEISIPKSKAGKPRDEYNVYALSDALGDRDRRELWVQYQRAQASGLVVEEIFWKLLWQIKNMMMVSRGSSTPTPESLKMNPFVFKKALAAARNFSEQELIALHRDFLVVYHEARRGKVDLATGVEHRILTL